MNVINPSEGLPYELSYEELQDLENAALQDLIAYENRPYHEKRRDEYPPIADYIDGLVKNDQIQIDAYFAACLAVKAKYPKPSNNNT
jgi:hypothetical protein